MKWQHYSFVWEDVDYHPHNGAEMSAGWTVHDPYGKYVFHVEGTLEDAKGALLVRLERDAREDTRVAAQMRAAFEAGT